MRLLGSVDAIVAQQSGMKAQLLGHGTGPVPPELAEFFPDLAETATYHRLRLRREDG